LIINKISKNNKNFTKRKDFSAIAGVHKSHCPIVAKAQ
jgi:hypothetical protein